VWNSNNAVWHGEPRLLFQLEVLHSDGSWTTVNSDGTWRVHDGPTRADSVQVGEDYDARLERPGWDRAGFDDATWAPARLLEPLDGALRPRLHDPIRVVRTVRPVGIASPRPGTYVFDMGENIAGWARIHVSGPAGTTVQIRYAEKTREDGTVDNDCDIIYAEIQVDRYTLKGEGIETWEARFSYKGFQFVQVDGWPGVPTLDDVEGREVHTDVESAAEFETSDELLNAIHSMTRRALLNNLYGIPTDTPVYEKNGWTGDAHLTAETALTEFRAHNVYAKWLDDIADAQQESGLVPLIVPCPDWGRDDSPEWGAAYPLITWYLYNYTGDRRILDRHYGAIRDYVDYLISRQEDGISPSVLGDWVAPGQKDLDPEGPMVSATAYVWQDITLLSRMADLLGITDDARGYRRFADRIRDTLNAKCLDRDAGVYHTDRDVGYRQTPNILPLAMEFAPADMRARVLENLVADIHAHGDHLNTGILGTKYLLPLLTQNGHVDLAFRIATQRTWPSWGLWVAQGATALWEAWDLNSRSRSHHMFGSIEDWFFQYLAGIKPAAPGYSRIKVKPYLPTGLQAARASIRTVRGTVASAWERDGAGNLSLDIEVPVQATALVHIPAAEPGAVHESGKPLEGRSDVKFLHMDGDRAVCGIGSGVYRFTSSIEPAE
jgi:alpha-L-rhamnosidase